MSHDMRGHVVVSKTSIPTSIIISNTYTHNLLFTHTHQILNFFLQYQLNNDINNPPCKKITLRFEVKETQLTKVLI